MQKEDERDKGVDEEDGFDEEEEEERAPIRQSAPTEGYDDAVGVILKEARDSTRSPPSLVRLPDSDWIKCKIPKQRRKSPEEVFLV